MDSLKLSQPFNYNVDKEFSNLDFISFWDQVAKKHVHWDKIYNKVYSGNEYNPQWFKGGLTNVSNNALDVHLKTKEGRDRVALYHECPKKGITNQITYGSLWEKVCKFASVLKKLNIGINDHVLIFMPNMIETIVALLACARIGAVVCTTYAAYTSSVLSTRIEHFKPKLILTVNFSISYSNDDFKYYLPTIKDAIELSTHKIEHVIVLDRVDFISKDEQLEFINKNKYNEISIDNLLDWETLTKDVEPLIEYEPLDSLHTLYVSYTSGTTGHPKGVVIETGGFLVRSNYLFKTNYGFQPGETYFVTADLGWTVGLNAVYFALLCNSTYLLYEYDFAHPQYEFFNSIQEKKVNVLLTVPSMFRIFKKMDPEAENINKYDLSSIKSFACVGEILESSIVDYIQTKIKKPVMDIFGQTEGTTLSTYSGPFQFPFKKGSCGKPSAGNNILILSPATKQPAKVGEIGEVVIRLPLPPFFALTILLDVDQEKYFKKYLNEYPGYYRTNDLGYFDEDGYLFVVSRIDDTINLGGFVLYCKSFEDIITNNSKVLDCSVAAIQDDILGQMPCAFVVVKDQFKDEYQSDKSSFTYSLKHEINSILNESYYLEAGGLKHLIIVDKLPMTRSNKKIRNILSKLFDDKEFEVPLSMSNAEIIPHLKCEIGNFKSNIVAK